MIGSSGTDHPSGTAPAGCCSAFAAGAAESSDASRDADTPRRAVETAGDQLKTLISARWALSWRHLIVCLMFGGTMLLLNYRPLADSATWLAADRGEWIVAHGALPTADAAQPLSDGMRLIDTCWLSDVLLGLVDRWGGMAYVSNLFALVEMAALLVMARVFYLQTGRVGVMLAGTGLFVLFSGGLQPPVGPELFGRFCFAVLLWIVVGSGVMDPGGADPDVSASHAAGTDCAAGRTTRARQYGLWPATAVLFIAWANLHGSFLLGILVLVCVAAGKAIAVALRQRSMAAAISDRATQRAVLLAEVALAASLLNPYGIEMLLENLRLLANTNVRETAPWLPLALPQPPAVLLLGSLALLVVVFRQSRRRVHPTEVLLLVGFGIGTIPTARMLPWYAAAFALVVAPHLGDIAARFVPRRRSPGGVSPEEAVSPSRFTVTFICGLVLWTAFAFSPMSREMLGGNPRTVAQLCGPDMPAGVLAHFREHPPQGLIFAPLQWTGWLLREAPERRQVYMTADVAWVPRRVFSDHARLARAESRWSRAFDRYAVETLVVQKQQQPQLAQAVLESSDWRVDYQDQVALVARRVAEDARAADDEVDSGGAEGPDDADDPCGCHHE